MFLEKKLVLKDIHFYRNILKRSKHLRNGLNLKYFGRIDVNSRGDGYEYYHVEKVNDRYTRKYIKNKYMDQISSSLNYSYLNKVESFAENKILVLNNILDTYFCKDLDSLYDDLHPGKQALVSPIIPTSKDAIKTWINTPYERHNSYKPNKELITYKQELVKSKTELTLADMFYTYNIPYKYECPLHIGSSIIFPDFTFLHPVTRKEIYWEHFGTMDDINYARDSIMKIEKYSKAGIIVGKNLIITFETNENVLSKRMALQLLKEYGLLLD